MRQREEEELDRRILDLYLQCHSFREIGEKLGIRHETAKRRLIKFVANLEKFYEIRHPESLQLYNVWNVKGLSPSQLQYPEQTP